MFRALVRDPYPNRIELYPDGRGPISSPGFREFDPTIDIQIYVDGHPIRIQSFIWDYSNNRYIMFVDSPFNTRALIQVIHHMPNPPFQTLSNPLLFNHSGGRHPDLGEGGVLNPFVIQAIAVNPDQIILDPGETTTFGATVVGTGNLGITWNASQGSILPTGLYTAPLSKGFDTVTATSIQDTKKTASASVSVRRVLTLYGPDMQTVMGTNGGYMVFDKVGNLYVSGGDKGCINVLDPKGGVTSHKVTGITISPSRLAIGPDGTLYTAPYNQRSIYKINPSTYVSTYMGEIPASYTGDDAAIMSLAADAAGVIYAGTVTGGVFQFDLNGVVTNIGGLSSGTPPYLEVYSLCVSPSGYLYAGMGPTLCVYTETSPNVYGWVVLAGDQTTSGNAVGAVGLTRLSQPWGLAVDSTENVFLGDCNQSNPREDWIKKVLLTPGIITLRASVAYSGNLVMDGTPTVPPAGGVPYYWPQWLCYNKGFLYIFDGVQVWRMAL
jgi:WD40 repeat protein